MCEPWHRIEGVGSFTERGADETDQITCTCDCHIKRTESLVLKSIRNQIRHQREVEISHSLTPGYRIQMPNVAFSFFFFLFCATTIPVFAFKGSVVLASLSSYEVNFSTREKFSLSLHALTTHLLT